MDDQERTEEQSGSRRRGRRRKRKDGLLTTGDMARLSNSTLRTVRFYEEENILRPTLRSEGGHRLFATTELEKLLLVTDMRAAGLSLDEIKTILEIKQSSSTGAQASQRIGQFLQDQINAMRDKVQVLQRLQEDFASASGVFATCQHCSLQQGYPLSCQSCDVMGHPDNLPRTVRVLWRIGNGGGNNNSH